MSEYNNNNKSISNDFFWEIPGDVPGKRAKTDPFQGERSPPESDYQLSSHLLTRQSSKDSSIVSDSSDQTETDCNHASTSAISNNKPFIWLPILIVLLLVIGPGGMSHQHLINRSDMLSEIYISESTPKSEPNNTQNIASPTIAIKQSKVFELILGEKDKTAQSKLRVMTHEVVKGDTLWDIAETYVKDPFRYPELAELSKIKNPDLIYPYERVRIHIYE